MRALAVVPWLVPLALLAAWQAVTATGLVPATVLPAPLAVARVAARLTASGALAVDLAVSAARALAGLAVGGGIGLALGLANGLSRTAERIGDSTLQMLRNIPHLALIPLVILWFGVGETAKLFLVALGVFFPVYVNTFYGVRSVDRRLLEMARVYGIRGRALFTRVILPGALPSIFVGLRFALGVMWLTLIVAETIGATRGIGHMATEAREFYQTDVVVLSIIVYALLGKLADAATRRLEHRFLPPAAFRDA